jgi:sulfite reductase (NADPH) flavoprotein alpha-component
MAANIPYIPENAPFTPGQRASLNGVMAGIFYSTPSLVNAGVKASMRIAVLYASQSGTAEGLARKLAKELKAQGHVPAVSTLVGYTPAALAEGKYAILLVSTYGEGEAPDGVQPFYEHLCLERFPQYANLSYAVFALGDHHYESFCKFGKDLDAKLASLGANWICNRVECDVDVDAPFEQWKTKLIPRLREIAAGSKAKAIVPSSVIAEVRPGAEA